MKCGGSLLCGADIWHAQSLLVSAWKVEDDATAMWMQTFYREAQSKTPSEAAREAIRTVRRDGWSAKWTVFTAISSFALYFLG